MKGLDSPFVPSFYVKNKGEESVKIALSLTRAKQNFVIRLTGGCGCMDDSEAEGLYRLFLDSLKEFEGAILFGGTRMIKRSDRNCVKKMITEIPPLLKKQNESLIILGVIPKTQAISIVLEYGLVIENDAGDEFLTIVHPDLDICLLVQSSVDRFATWDDEFEECMIITEYLRQYADWKSLLVCFNGGGTTEREIVATAKKGWPVILLKGSGRMTDQYAMDQIFLETYPNVLTADCNVDSFQEKLAKVGAIKPKFRLINKNIANQ